ncbi:uncharacterized protein LOC121410905 [Lytechinus variegatus]|uniref:uncharacterized protein LOC121410905 n=1 Tax=Lytechinus variegatus TaxID=7654 RepID=UPI001BB0E32B|nr:uncharacterized protein LOC121410905 [Lytechinus variegatus]
MTTLPRLAPAETSIKSILHPGICDGEPKRKSFSSIGYRELSNSWGGSATHHIDDKPTSHTAQGLGRSYPRLDPLHPPKFSRTVSLETTNPHFQNELRSLNMKREQYHKYHRSWMKPIYGSKLEQEDHRKHIRSSLKDQMSEKDSRHKTFMKDRFVESQTAVAYDRKCLDADKEALKKKSLYLHQFRDENKKLMEKKWEDTRQTRDHSNVVEQELLKYNPINWSQSLR